MAYHWFWLSSRAVPIPSDNKRIVMNGYLLWIICGKCGGVLTDFLDSYYLPPLGLVGFCTCDILFGIIRFASIFQICRFNQYRFSWTQPYTKFPYPDSLGSVGVVFADLPVLHFPSKISRFGMRDFILQFAYFNTKPFIMNFACASWNLGGYLLICKAFTFQFTIHWHSYPHTVYAFGSGIFVICYRYSGEVERARYLR